jgi:Methyltransferase domain
MSEFDRWESRYSVPDYIFGKEPSEFLVSCNALLPARGKALAIADGEGRNGVWLAKQGLDVVSVEFSPAAQEKAKRLAEEMNVAVMFDIADVHVWDYPPNMFEVVIDIFTQFSSPADRIKKWEGVRNTLKKGGLLILQGYTPKQLDYGTGGPKDTDHLYTRDLLETHFSDFNDIKIIEEETVLREGSAHSGMSAIIGMTAIK